MAETLIKKQLPTIQGIKDLYAEERLTVEELNKKKFLREELNTMLQNGTIDLYPNFKEENDLIKIVANSKNTKEFRYES